MGKNGQAGFSLLETIVAFLVLALVAGALQLCLAGGWRGVGAVRHEQAALQLARTRLAETGTGGALAEGIDEGATEDGFAWTREIRRHGQPDSAGTEPGAAVGYWISVSVRWQDAPFRPGRSVSLTTLKLGRAE